MSSSRTDDETDSGNTRHHSSAPTRGTTQHRRESSTWNYFEPCPPPERNGPISKDPYSKCKFCGDYITTNPTRAKQHLLGNIIKGDAPACLGLYGHIGLEAINVMYNVIGVPPGTKYKRSNGSHMLISIKGRRSSMANSNSQASIHGSNNFEIDDNTNTQGRSRGTSLSNPIMDAFQIPHRKHLDKLWAKAFYTSGIPFNAGENPFFRDAVHETSKGLVHGYSLPKRPQLADSLLKESRADLKQDMEKTMREAKPYGYTLSSDGWENIRREPLMNIMLLTSKGDFFLDSWNAAQADKKDGKYLGEMWLKYIEQVGADRVIQIVTDGAAANRVGGEEVVMKKYPHMTWSWCAAHVFDLLLEDMIGNRKIVMDDTGHNPFKTVFIKLRWIVKAVSRSQKLSAIFVRKSPQRKLLNPNATRFATNFLMAQRALELRAALQEMVIDDAWHSYYDRLPLQPKSRGHMTKGKAEELKLWIQRDPFWIEVKATVDFFIPLVKMLREFDGNLPQSAWLYWSLKRGIYDLEESMQACFLVTEDLKPKIRHVYMTRKKSLTTDFMLAAAYLNPHMFFDEEEDVAGNAELCVGFNKYIGRYAEKVVGNGPNHDSDVEAFISLLLYQATDAQKKIPTTSVAMRAAQSSRYKYTPGEWWHTFGASYTELRILARKILHQKMCASACERNWSAYAFIHSKVRNRLTNDRAKDLVYVFTNMRVEKGLTKVRNPHTFIYKRYYEREARMNVLRPTSTENPSYEDNAILPSFGEDDIDDFDTIDDADADLQGLSLDDRDDFLTRFCGNTDVIDSEGWENEMDSEQYPTIDESQAYEDQYLDRGIHINAPSNESYVVAESSHQQRSAEGYQSGGIGGAIFRESMRMHSLPLLNPYQRPNALNSRLGTESFIVSPIGEASSFPRRDQHVDSYEPHMPDWLQEEEDKYRQEQQRNNHNRHYNSQP